MADTQNNAAPQAALGYATGGNIPVWVPPAPETAVRERATIDFGFKSDPVEVEYEGEVGLICEGWASKYMEEDASGEAQMPGAFSIIAEEWGAQKEPLVLFNHALDKTIRGRPIGRGIGVKLEPDGVQVRVFIPRNAAEKWTDPRARKRFGEIYNGIKNRSINAFSVGGAFWRLGKKLLNWATTEISVTPTPCLGSATFTLGSKALVDRYGALPVGLGDEGAREQSALGKVTRPHWDSVMGFAKQDGDAALHDHLLGMSYAPEFQGKHDSEDCPICSERRDMMGVKAAALDTTPQLGVCLCCAEDPCACRDDCAECGGPGDCSYLERPETGGKATTKKEDDGFRHPPDHYLVVEDPDKATTFHLWVKNHTGAYDRKLCAMALAALRSNFRGNPYEGPNKKEALAKLKRIYQDQGWDWPEDAAGGGKAVWSAAQVNDYPDASFAYVEPGEKDSEGKTTPRSKRHLPYKDAQGKPDAAHVRNALARLDQADIPDAAKASARKKLVAAAKKLGIEVSDEGPGGKADGMDADAVLRAATDLLAEYGQGVKAGRKHSKETKAAVQKVVDHLTGYFGLARPEDDDAEEASEASED